jgi:hypothetical protein
MAKPSILDDAAKGWIDSDGTPFTMEVDMLSQGYIKVDGSLGDCTLSNNGADIRFTRADANYITAETASGFLVFRTGGDNERVRVDDNGLDVTGNIDVTTDLIVDGKTGIGRTPTTDKLEVAGNIVASGDITAAGTFSDISLKENIEKINGALDKVSQINGYTFNYKARPNEKFSGVIAQELQEVMPELVYKTWNVEQEDYISAVRYSHITAYLIEAIKELKIRIEELEKK